MSSFYLRQGKSNVETGELRERISVCERETYVDKKTGIQKVKYNELVKTRAKIIGESGKEFLGADKELTRIRKRVYIRRRNSLKVLDTHFIEYEGYMYSIYEVFPYDALFLEIRMERVEK